MNILVKYLLILSFLFAGCACSDSSAENSNIFKEDNNHQIGISQKYDLRVVIKFKKILLFNDEHLIKDMSMKIDGEVVYISSLSDYTHVYLLINKRNAKAEELINLLKQNESIEWVEVDQLSQPL